MILELTNDCASMKELEQWAIGLVNSGAAQKVKDSSIYDKQTDGFKVNGENRFNTKVYHCYIVKVKDLYSYLPVMAKIRFWEDKRLNKAGIRISRRSLESIVRSKTISSILRQHDVNLIDSDKDKVDLSKTAEYLTKVLTDNGKSINSFVVTE